MRQRRGKGGSNVARKSKTSVSKKGVTVQGNQFLPANVLDKGRIANNMARGGDGVGVGSPGGMARSAQPLIDIDEEQVYNLLQTFEVDSINDLIEFSIQLYRQSGIYRRAVGYFGNMLTFDHYIWPYTLEEQFDTGMLEFRNVAYGVDRYKIKKIMPEIIKRIIVHGTAFMYKLENSDRIEFFDLPWRACRVRGKEANIYRVLINLSEISEDEILDDEGEFLDIYPQEIQEAWVANDEGTLDEENLVDEDWFILSDMAFAMSLDENILINGGVGIPYFLAAMMDGVRFERAKSLLDDIDALDNAKIIDLKFKVNEDGENLMDEGTVLAFIQMINEAIPEGVHAFASPFDAQVLNLQGNVGATGKMGLAEKHKGNFMGALGINPLVFGQEANSGEAMRLSIKLDHNILYSVITPQVEAYMDFELENNMSAFGGWRLTMPTNSHAFRSDSTDLEAAGLAFGTSRLRYMALAGYTPIEAINILPFEQFNLQIDTWMVPKQNANTLSGDQNEGGRPRDNNPSAAAEATRDRQ